MAEPSCNSVWFLSEPSCDFGRSLPASLPAIPSVFLSEPSCDSVGVCGKWQLQRQKMSRDGQGRTRSCLPYPPAAITSSSRAGRDSCRESSNDDEPADEAPLLSLLPLFSTSIKNLEAKAPDFTLPHPPPLRPSRPPHPSDHELSDGFLDEIVDSLAARDTSSLRLDTLVAQGRIH